MADPGVGSPAGVDFRAPAEPVAPLQYLAAWVASLRGWRRYGLAWLLGALAAGALPPVDLVPLLVVSFCGLVWLADGCHGWKRAFGVGWSFGCGFFVAGLYWIAAALFVDIAMFWWMVPFAVFGLPAFLGIFTGAVLVFHRAFCKAFGIDGVGRTLVLAAGWCGAEWLRGHVLTGFPWNLVGYAWSGGFPGGTAMLQTTAYVGIYGLSLLTVVAACLPATLGDLGRRHVLPTVAAAVLIALPLIGGMARLEGAPTSFVPGTTLRLVQPSIAQNLRATEETQRADFQRQVILSTEPASGPLAATIWAEAGAPPFIERNASARLSYGLAAPEGGLVIGGTVRTDFQPAPPTHYWNSLVAVKHSGEIVGFYDKFHLVPFGEYVPLRNVLPIAKITAGNVDFSTGPGPRTLDLPGLPPVGPLICYEVIFPGEVVDPSRRPEWLLNITNDAWYGFTSGPFQHFAIARVRAVEEGLPLVRVANNGISGAIDPLGRVVARLGLDAVSFLDVPLPQAVAVTVFHQYGDKILFGGLILILVFAPFVGRIGRQF